jgi:hypothetical protein
MLCNYKPEEQEARIKMPIKRILLGAAAILAACCAVSAAARRGA